LAGLNRRNTFAAIALPLLFLAQLGLARANTITVTSLSDTGAMGICVLRDAITAANSKTATYGCAAGSGTDSIVFEPGLTGTIALGSTLPTITDSSLTITGPTGSPGIMISGGDSVLVMNVGGGATNLQNLTIADGSSPSDGGGIKNTSTLTVTNCTFSGNSSFGGGGIYNDGTLTVIKSTLSRNSAGNGGGIQNFDTLTVTNSTFSDNPANNGGGIFNSGTLTVTNSTFSGNGFRVGGGIANTGSGTLTVTNSTFSGNVAAEGGALASEGTLTVTNSTFSGNGFGGIVNLGSATLKGTILAAEPFGGNCAAGASTPPVTDAGYNISDDDSCGFTEAPSGKSINGSTTLNLDPAGLQNNGGPTQTIALEPNSQAVDFIPVADCTDQSMSPVKLTTDQRGFPRPDSGNLNACDVGAFELQTGRLTVVPGSERTQIARSTSGTSDQVNMAFTFTDSGSPFLDDILSMGPNCEMGNDALNGIDVDLYEGTCNDLATAAGGLLLDLSPFVVHTVNHQSYGTLFQSSPTSPETVSARIAQLAKPLGTCGQWTINIEVAGLDTAAIGLGGGNPFALVVEDGDKNEGCFDVNNAIVGNQIPTPIHKVRRGVRR
jgi:predicted outer membrane repeat protein